jgi:hypothetical protein
MVIKKYYYERSNLLESNVNINFEELLWMDDAQTEEWIENLRKFIISEWDEKGIPPTIGQDTKDLKKNFMKLREYDVHHKFLVSDDDGNRNVIKNYNKHASGVNQFFPTMLKTRVQNGSIYDWFTDEYKDKFQKVILRILKRDSMYNWSKCVLVGEGIPENFFIVQHKHNQVESEYKTLSVEEVEKLDDKHKTNLPKELDGKTYKFLVRDFQLGQKLFPAGIQAFRLGLGQPAVNFPPLTARYLYEKYTEHISQDLLNVYDPSAGWGGRILGAMSSLKRIHYIGTDPNTDNYIDELGKTRYEYVADFFNNEVLETNPFWEEEKNTYHLFQDGSEFIGNNSEFQTYKGTLDLVFTSPPYFDREQYSEDEEQSYKLYPKYDSWRDGFLKPTLVNAYESLRENRYLLWNIADIKIGKNKYHPLEQDSIDIIESLGGEYKGKLKMLMTSMVGVDQSNVKNAVKINGTYLKYEPIFIFYKPKKT